MNPKLNTLQKYMIENHLDMIYQDDPNSVAYFTNFESNPHERIVAYVVTQNDHFLFVPSLEKSEAISQSNVNNVYSYTDNEDPWTIIRTATNDLVDKVISIGIDQINLSVERYFNLQNVFDTKNFIDISSTIENMRLVKTPDEIDKMLLAGKLADEAIQIGISLLKEGVTEQEVAAKIDMEMKKKGVSEMSFTTLVLFGDHAASPHGNTGNRKLQRNELVLFDLGVIIEGYASDVSRTVAFGEISSKENELYNLVLHAQETAQKSVRPGVRAGELDQIARNIIKKAGYGEYFTHRLGHGIGKTAHEFPSINSSDETILVEGMCFSIEPGIYIENEVGIRIEDCVYVTKNGSKAFTITDKALLTIDA